MSSADPNSWGRTTLRLYDDLRKEAKLGLPELRSAVLRISSCTLEEKDELRRRIADFTPNDGWLRCQSELAICRRGSWSGCKTKGVPLTGELNNERRSVALRHVGEGWKWTVFEESPEGRNDGEHFLVQEVDLLAENEMLAALTKCTGSWKLRYDVFWRVQKGCPSRRAAYCFKGFRKEDD